MHELEESVNWCVGIFDASAEIWFRFDLWKNRDLDFNVNFFMTNIYKFLITAEH